MTDNPIIRVLKNGRVKSEEKLEALQYLQNDDDVYVLKALGKTAKTAKLVSVAETVDKAKELVLQGDEIRGLSTGYTELDQMTRGINPSEIVLVFADTGVGKSQLCQNITLNLATAGHPVLFIGLEMSNEENTARFLSMSGNRGGVEELPIFYPHPDESLNYRNISNIVETSKNDGVELVVIDHLHMFQTDGGNRADGLEQVCAELKSIARHYKVPILLAAQTNRGEGMRGTPHLRDLRGSVAIEQIADVAMALSKDPEDDPRLSPLDVVLRKQRKGWRKVSTKFIGDENARLKPFGVMDILPGREYL